MARLDTKFSEWSRQMQQQFARRDDLDSEFGVAAPLFAQWCGFNPLYSVEKVGDDVRSL